VLEAPLACCVLLSGQWIDHSSGVGDDLHHRACTFSSLAQRSRKTFCKVS